MPGAPRSAGKRLSTSEEMTLATLRSAAASPFGRKCSIATIVLGLEDQINKTPADTSDPNEPLLQQNPLGKIPALVLDDGQTLFDSRVITAYLDHLAGGAILYPSNPTQRFEVLRLEALADGLMDAAILQIYEKRFRAEEEFSQGWVDRQAGKVTRAMSHLEGNLPPNPAKPNAGTIALACALGYLDFRFGGTWRSAYPNLVGWLDEFRANVPAYDATSPGS